MTAKRKTTLKQIFNAWIKYQKKQEETYKAKSAVQDLANKVESYTTELIEYEEEIYRLTIRKSGYCNTYDIHVVAKTTELPIKN
jgi:hypothetical protein